jgi:hypothetical protein
MLLPARQQIVGREAWYWSPDFDPKVPPAERWRESEVSVVFPATEARCRSLSPRDVLIGVTGAPKVERS